MRIKNAFILLASVPSLLAYIEPPLEQELTADGIINWLRGGGSNFKTEGKFRRRDDPLDSCTYGYASEAFSRFTGIFFGDFITTGGQGILGPLAVRGNMSSSTYNVNSNHHVDCSDIENNLNGYGLVVGGHYNGGLNTVRGATFLPEGTDTSKIRKLDSSCPIVTDRGTGLLNFDQTHTNAIFASKELSKLAPTLLLHRNGTLSKLNNPAGKFQVATMDTCKGGCTFHENQLSYPKVILFGVGYWGGPWDMSWPEYLVINIPVTIGSTITLASNKPSEDTKACTTVYNFYPADAVGNYSPGRIYINRDTGGPLVGLTLAPEADINEFRTGNFVGQLIANNYNWKNGGVAIKDYSTLDGSCTSFLGCLPLSNITRPMFPPAFIELPPASTSSVTFSTVTDPLPSSTDNFSTVTDPLPSSTDNFSTVTDPLPSYTDNFSTVTDLPVGPTHTDQTIGGSSHITVTVKSSSTSATDITETFVVISTTTITHSTVTEPIRSTSATDQTIEVVTETSTPSSESKSSSKFTTNTTSTGVTITISSKMPTISEEVEYCTYGGYPHIHEGEWYDHKEFQNYDEDDSDDDDEENDDDEEYNDDKHYHNEGYDKKHYKDD